MSERIRLVVLFGGQSAEHEVSLVTARHVLAAADPDRYDIQPVAITATGRWVLAEATAKALLSGPDALPAALPAEGPEVNALATVTSRGDETVVVLPLLHGPLGEDGTVQGLLELAGVAYVGTGVLGSALAMDKGKAKEVCAANGIPQARFRVLHEREAAEPATAGELVGELGLPLFVKPANMGSSVGVSKAHDLPEVRAALQTAAEYDEWIVVEETVTAREVECGVLGNLDPRASVVGEVIPGAEFYDYDDKYVDDLVQIVVPADLPSAVAEQTRALAVRAFRVLRCEGMARVDFFYDQSGRGVLLNEVNTIPGFTPASMFPKLWEATGLGYGELIDELVELAIERHARRVTKRRTV